MGKEIEEMTEKKQPPNSRENILFSMVLQVAGAVALHICIKA